MVDDDDTSLQNLKALESFLVKFPRFVDRDLYLTGESYGGVFVPTLAERIRQQSNSVLKSMLKGSHFKLH